MDLHINQLFLYMDNYFYMYLPMLQEQTSLITSQASLITTNNISGYTSGFLAKTDLSSAIKGNGNLSRPSEMPETRKTIYKKIAESGYEATAKEECNFSYVMPFIKRHIPKGLKKSLKKLLG